MGRKINLLKSNFSSGEIDPDALVRPDIKHYYSGAAYLGDVFVKPLGGVKRRYGSRFVSDLTSLIANDDEVRFVSFEFSVDDTFLLIFLDGEIKVVKDGAIIHTITSTPWTGAQLRQINWTQSYDTLIVLHREVAPQRIVRITDTNWTVTPLPFDYIPKYNYTPATSTPAGSISPSAVEGKVTITGVGTTFTSGFVGQKIEGNGGLVRIVQFNSTTSLIGVVEIPFFNTTSIATGAWTYQSGYEDAWSVSRGWPVAGSFHGGRLYLGGGPRPSTINGSRVGSFFDFEMLTGLDDEACEVTLDNDGLNEIVNIMSLRDLLIFTTGGEFVETNKPITPNNFGPLQNTRRGSDPYVRNIELEGAALFVQRKGKAVREFYFTDTEGSYVAENLTLLASHLVNQPVDFVKRNANSTSESDLLVMLNADGTCRVCSIIRSQEVVAWSRIGDSTAATKGFYVAAGLDDDEIYFCVRRTINGSTKYFLEVLDENHVLDCSVRVTAGLPVTSVTAAHLPNTLVSVFADDADFGDITLNGSGVGTIQGTVDDYYEVGLNFVPDVLTMPIEQEFQEGTTIGKKKRIIEATLELFDTTYIEVNGNQVSFRQFGDNLLDEPPTKKTGRVTEEAILGYDDKAQLRITQSRPGFMDLRGVSVKVAF